MFDPMMIMRQLLALLMFTGIALTMPITVPSALADAPATVQPLTLEQATARLHAKVGGRVLGAKTVVVEDVGRVYEIKVLLKPGKVKVFWVSPTTGELL